MQRFHGCCEIRYLILSVSLSRPCEAFSGPKDGRKDRWFSFLFKMPSRCSCVPPSVSVPQKSLYREAFRTGDGSSMMLTHVMIVVKDQNKALEFYIQKMGF